MTNFPRSPRLFKFAIMLIDTETSVVQRNISLQYNPEKLIRTLKEQTFGEEGGLQSGCGNRYSLSVGITEII
jgi:hypothetical protein